jgi:hypothetical protein
MARKVITLMQIFLGGGYKTECILFKLACKPAGFYIYSMIAFRDVLAEDFQNMILQEDSR